MDPLASSDIVEGSAKKRVKEVASRFMQPVVPLSQNSISQAKKDGKNTTSKSHMPAAKKPQPHKSLNVSTNTSLSGHRPSMPPRLAPKAPTNLPSSTMLLPPKPTTNINKYTAHDLVLLYNLLSLYSYCNAAGDRLLLHQQEKAEKSLLLSYGKVHKLREEVHNQKLLLSQYKYLIALDAIISLQENHIPLSELSAGFDNYQCMTQNVSGSLNSMPIDMTIQPRILDTISEISTILSYIFPVLTHAQPTSHHDSFNTNVDLAAKSINHITIAAPQERLKLDYCNNLLRILGTIENQLSSLNMQLIEERLFDEM